MREINLLPTSRRKYLRQQWTYDSLRRFIYNVNIALLIMTGAALASLIGLRSVSFLATTDAESTIPEFLGKYQTIRQSIEKKNALIAQTSKADQERIVWSDYLVELFNILPPGTVVNRLTVNSSQRSVVLTGSTVNRNSLTLLNGRIEGLSWAKEVKAPLANLLDRDNPTFSFTVVLDATTP